MLNAATFGLVVGLQALARPGDLLVLSPVALLYAGLLLRGVLTPDPKQRGVEGVAIGSGALGGAVPLALFLSFNWVTFGSLTGGYVGKVVSNGLDLWTMPKRLFSVLLASQVFFGEQNADWLSVIPLFFAAVAFLPVVLFTGPLVFRAAAAAVIVQFAVYGSYADLLPTGMFRFLNIHYFKWLAPVAIGIAFYFLKTALVGEAAARRRARWALAAGILVELLILSVTAVETIRLASAVTQKGQDIAFDLGNGDRGVDFVDLMGVGGGWTDVYFALQSSVVLDGTRQLAPVSDFRLLPIKEGVRLLFFRPVDAHHATVHLGKGVTITRPLSDADVQIVDVDFRLGLPLSQQWIPAQPKSAYAMGETIAFSTAGQAQRYLGEGWSGAEPWGRWIDGNSASVELNVGNTDKQDLELRLVLIGFIVPPAHPKTSAEIYANGNALGRVVIASDGNFEETFRIPGHVVDEEGGLKLEFRNQTPASPCNLKVNEDTRSLGIGGISMQIVLADGRQQSEKACR